MPLHMEHDKCGGYPKVVIKYEIVTKGDVDYGGERHGVQKQESQKIISKHYVCDNCGEVFQRWEDVAKVFYVNLPIRAMIIKDINEKGVEYAKKYYKRQYTMMLDCDSVVRGWYLDQAING